MTAGRDPSVTARGKSTLTIHKNCVTCLKVQRVENVPRSACLVVSSVHALHSAGFWKAPAAGCCGSSAGVASSAFKSSAQGWVVAMQTTHVF